MAGLNNWKKESLSLISEDKGEGQSEDSDKDSDEGVVSVGDSSGVVLSVLEVKSDSGVSVVEEMYFVVNGVPELEPSSNVEEVLLGVFSSIR